MARVELTLIGHVTRDRWRANTDPGGPSERLGGPVAYAALAAKSLGVSVQVLTAAPPHSVLLERLKHQTIQLFLQPSACFTSFELEYQGGARQLWVRERADPLDAHTLACASADVAYVGPVLAELEPADVASLDVGRVVVGLQGWFRQVAADGRVLPREPAGLSDLPRHAELVFSEEDHPRAHALARRLSQVGHIVLVTRGERGARVWQGGTAVDYPAPRADEIDATGAGDVFGVAYTIMRQRGAGVVEAVERAQWVAARSVEVSGVGEVQVVDY